MKAFDDLNASERSLLLKFPVYISLLAVNNDAVMDKFEKNAAIKFAHIKTYSCNPLLSEFYREADKEFAANITKLLETLPADKAERTQIITDELTKIEKILGKLGAEMEITMRHSMKSFKDHVSKAHRNVLEDFIFPLPIKGINA